MSNGTKQIRQFGARRGGLVDEFWSGIIYVQPEAEHVCEDFGFVLASDGESCLMICRKCGKGWIAPSSIKKKAIGKMK
jgi:ribosomal protein L37AE/L43A